MQIFVAGGGTCVYCATGPPGPVGLFWYATARSRPSSTCRRRPS